MSLCASAIVSPAAARRGAAPAPTLLDRQLVNTVNAVRANRDLPALRYSPSLFTAANAHSREMGRRGYFDHDSFDGSSFWRRLVRYYGTSGYHSWTAGENLLWTSTPKDARAMVAMWMKSRGHRANLLSRRWRELGISAVHVADAPGVFDGRDATIVTADFGARS